MRLAILLCGLLGSGTLSAAERVVQESIRVDPDVEVSLELSRGEVRIVKGTGNTVELTARIRHPDEDVVEQVEILIDSSRSSVVFGVEHHRSPYWMFTGMYWWKDHSEPEIEFTIVVPEQASLTLRGNRVDFDVDAPSGTVDISSHRGSGRVRGVSSQLKIDTHRGDFDVEVEKLADIDINTHRGSVVMEIENARNFTLDGETHRGGIHVNGRDIDVDQRDRDTKVDYREGDGSNLISFNTHRGSITIDFRD